MFRSGPPVLSRLVSRDPRVLLTLRRQPLFRHDPKGPRSRFVPAFVKFCKNFLSGFKTKTLLLYLLRRRSKSRVRDEQIKTPWCRSSHESRRFRNATPTLTPSYSRGLSLLFLSFWSNPKTCRSFLTRNLKGKPRFTLTSTGVKTVLSGRAAKVWSEEKRSGQRVGLLTLPSQSGVVNGVLAQRHRVRGGFR